MVENYDSVTYNPRLSTYNLCVFVSLVSSPGSEFTPSHDRRTLRPETTGNREIEGRVSPETKSRVGQRYDSSRRKVFRSPSSLVFLWSSGEWTHFRHRKGLRVDLCPRNDLQNRKRVRLLSMKPQEVCRGVERVEGRVWDSINLQNCRKHKKWIGHCSEDLRRLTEIPL